MEFVFDTKDHPWMTQKLKPLNSVIVEFTSALYWIKNLEAVVILHIYGCVYINLYENQLTVDIQKITS